MALIIPGAPEHDRPTKVIHIGGRIEGIEGIFSYYPSVDSQQP